MSKPYIAGVETPAYTVEAFDAFDRKTKATAPDGSWVAVAYDGFETTMKKKMPGMNGTRLSGGAVAFAVGDFLELVTR